MTLARCSWSIKSIGNPLTLSWIAWFICVSVNKDPVVPSERIARRKCANASSRESGGGS